MPESRVLSGRRHAAVKIATLLAVAFLNPVTGAAHGRCAVDKVCLRDLVPSTSRWFRGLSMTASRIDQPDNLSSGDPPMPKPNPDEDLDKFEVTLQLDKMVWSTDELVAAYELANNKDVKSYIDAADFKTHHVQRKSTPLRFFARARPGDFGRRLVSAWTLSTGQAERETPEDPAVGDRDEYEETYAVVFDPKKMALSASRAHAAYKGLAAYTQVHAVRSGLPSCATRMNTETGLKECQPLAVGHPVEKLREVSGLGIWNQGKIAAIPSVKFETVDQFDFLVTGGGSVVRDDDVEGQIETVTVTWDLKAALDSSAQRRAALSALVLHQKQLTNDLALGEKLGIGEIGDLELCAGSFIRHKLRAEYGFGKVVWKGRSTLYPKTSPPRAAGLDLGKDGVFRGRLSAPGEVVVTACLSDDSSRKATSVWRFDVKDCQQGAAKGKKESNATEETWCSS